MVLAFQKFSTQLYYHLPSQNYKSLIANPQQVNELDDYHVLATYMQQVNVQITQELKRPSKLPKKNNTCL
jgi:hypothetical protein